MSCKQNVCLVGKGSKEKDIDARVKTSQTVSGQNFTNFLQMFQSTEEKIYNCKKEKKQ
jgi:hypothetical protein